MLDNEKIKKLQKSSKNYGRPKPPVRHPPFAIDNK